MIETHGKQYIVLHNERKIMIKNLLNYCREKKLSYNQMRRVCLGEIKQHKDYKTHI
jgi:ribosome recycling factor